MHGRRRLHPFGMFASKSASFLDDGTTPSLPAAQSLAEQINVQLAIMPWRETILRSTRINLHLIWRQLKLSFS